MTSVTSGGHLGAAKEHAWLASLRREPGPLAMPVQHGAMSQDEDSSVAEPPATDTLDHLRNLFELEVGWFRVAETKAQLILTANGIFISVLFGTALGKIASVQSLAKIFGPETWTLLLISGTTLTGAVGCAARSLWSWHHRRASQDFRVLGVDSVTPDSYRPEVLWYFGCLAKLPVEKAAERLRRFGKEEEILALSYNAVMLSHSLVRKYRLLNAGWALTAASLMAFMAAVTDVLVRAS